MSITVEKNLALLKSVVPENGEAFGLPRAVYQEFADNAELRLLHSERLTKFSGLLTTDEDNTNQINAFNQMRVALGMATAGDMKKSFGIVVDVLAQTEGMSEDEKKAFFKEKETEIKKGYYIDKDAVKHNVHLGIKTNANYMAAGMLASGIALFSGFQGFLVAFYNAALSGWSAKGHSENFFQKLKERPQIVKHYPSLFNMLLMESYVEYRMKLAFHPLEVQRDALIDNVIVELKNGDWKPVHTDQLAVVAAADTFAKLVNYAPARAIRLLQLEATEPDPRWRNPLAPQNAFTPYSRFSDAIRDTLGIEMALRNRFSYDNVGAAVRSGVDNQLKRAGVDPDKPAPPTRNVDEPDRFTEISEPIRTAADKLADAFLDGNKSSDLPIVSRILMPDIDDIPEADRVDTMKQRMSTTLQRLAVSMQHDRWSEKGDEKSRVQSVVRQRAERQERREARAI